MEKNETSVFAVGGPSEDKAHRASWADDLFTAMMDADPVRLGSILDEAGKGSASASLDRSGIGGRPIFWFGNTIYCRAGSLRDILGGGFQFEREDERDRIASWLEMIDAAKGDSLMHIIMRVNGVSDERKARCAVEVLGRGGCVPLGGATEPARAAASSKSI